jgi:protein-disulfide isomerase/uncharacterized membrane protein
MAVKMEIVLNRWLHSLKISVSSSYLSDKLRSHSDYPSLSSITAALDELGIDNAALVVDKEKLDKLPVPFLAHSSVNGGRFIVVKNIKKQILKNTKFEKNWNGIAVLAEKPENWYHADNASNLVKETKVKYQIILAGVVIILFAGISLFNHFSWQIVSLFLFSLVGLASAILIVQHELGISNELTEQLCSAGKNTDCEAVMHSKGSRVGKWFNWADAGIIYFSSFLLLLVSLSSGLLILAILSAAAIPFTFFSLYYQWQVVKKWCPLCLITVAILWMQFVLLLPLLTAFNLTAVGVSAIAFIAFIFTAVSAIWLLIIKTTLNHNIELTDKNYSLLRFKNNPNIFSALLKQQRKADITPFENDLQLGNLSAPLQIMVACDPYCRPCAKVHEALDKLTTKNDIGLTVRFAIKTGNREDKKLQAVEYVLRLLHGKSNAYKRRALHEWYAEMNMEKFNEKYLLKEDVNVDDLLIQHENWSEKTKIAFTPTIFINGNELPKQYDVADLRQLFQEWKNKEKAEDKQPKNEYLLV